MSKKVRHRNSSDSLWPGAREIPSGGMGFDSTLRDPDFIKFLKRKYRITARQYEEGVKMQVHASTSWVQRVIDRLLDTDVRSLEGDGLLDLGCGATVSETSHTETPDREYEPWLCRVLHAMGAKTAGADIGDNSTEEFPNHRLDLLQPAQLEMFDDDSFQIVHMRNVFHPNFSPSVLGRIQTQLMAKHRNYEAMPDDKSYLLFEAAHDAIKFRVVGEAARILMVDGYFVDTNTIYKKTRPVGSRKARSQVPDCLEKI